MAAITATMVSELRGKTDAPMMECKKALTEADGDMAKAEEILRVKLGNKATKAATRIAAEGVVGLYLSADGKLGALVELNSETDFVAKNDTFKAFCDDIARTVATEPSADLESLRVGAVAKIGENIRIARHARFDLSGPGLIAAYIHTGGKVGVLVEVGSTNDATPGQEAFKQLVKDLTLQIAAASPTAVDRSGVPAEVVAKEREIAAQADRLKGKPAQALEKILQGMLDKYFQTVCLVEQGFVKDPEKTVQQHIESVAKPLGDTITLRRFLRWQVGESMTA